MERTVRTPQVLNNLCQKKKEKKERHLLKILKVNGQVEEDAGSK